MTCHKPIKISKIDNPTSGQKKKLERFQLDELTPHQCVVKKNKEEATEETATTTTVLDNDPSQQIAALAEEIRGLKETVNILISQIRGSRSEIRQKK